MRRAMRLRHAATQPSLHQYLAGTSPRRAVALATIGIGLILAGVSMWLLWPKGQSGKSPLRDLSAIPVSVEFTAPELTLRDLSGKTASLNDFKGQVILVNLWATWCPPCKEEMPVFQAFYLEHRYRGFAVLAINDGESEAAVQSFVADQAITFPVWLDPKYEASEHAFRTANLPTSYVIDRDGIVRWMWIGAIDKPNLEKYVKPMLEE